MHDPAKTTPEMLTRAAGIGKQAGLRYVYAGNLPGEVGELENTRCPGCRALLVERYGYLITGYHLTSTGGCPKCGKQIPGRWAERFEGQITHLPFLPRLRRSASLVHLS
jgi:pyruvate formate lyase activating enzyme